jgi:hypothetical protein
LAFTTEPALKIEDDPEFQFRELYNFVEGHGPDWLPLTPGLYNSVGEATTVASPETL